MRIDILNYDIQSYNYYLMEGKQHNIQCPKCKGSSNVIPIINGRPNAQLIEEAKQGKVFLGGCSPNGEDYYCKECKFEFIGKTH
jgi:hypothetical protein